MDEKPTNLDKTTTVNFFAIATAFPTLVGGILWLSNIDAKATTAKEDLDRARTEMVGVKEMIIDVRERSIRIEEQLKFLRGKK